jgi:hypothetical protein
VRPGADGWFAGDADVPANVTPEKRKNQPA